MRINCDKGHIKILKKFCEIEKLSSIFVKHWLQELFMSLKFLELKVHVPKVKSVL